MMGALFLVFADAVMTATNSVNSSSFPPRARCVSSWPGKPLKGHFALHASHQHTCPLAVLKAFLHAASTIDGKTSTDRMIDSLSSVIAGQMSVSAFELKRVSNTS